MEEDTKGFWAGEAADEPTAAPPASVSWTASEFIAHHKGVGWYVTLGAVALVFAALLLLVTRDLVPSAVVIVAAIILGAYGSRQPREIEYRVYPPPMGERLRNWLRQHLHHSE